MTGAEKIIEKILQEAQTQANAIHEQAERECEEIVRSGKAQADAQAQALIEKSERDAAEAVRRMKAVAELDGRKNILAAKQEVISEAFDAAEKQLASMPREAYGELMKQVATVQALPGDVICYAKSDADVFNESFVQDVNKRRGKGAGISLGEPVDIQGGFLLRSGAMERNCSLEALLRIVREKEEAQVAAILFD